MTVHGASREMIFLFLLIMGTARSFEFSTLQTLVPALVEPEVLPQAMAAASSVRQAATIIGPMLGGFLYLAGPVTVYYTSAFLFLVSALTVALIPVRQTPSRREPASWRTVMAGITFIRSNPVVLGAISLDLFAVLLGGATALLPIFARDILAAGPTGLGVLRAAPAVGALAASIYLARTPLTSNVGRTLFASVAGFGLMTILFALSRSLALSCVVLAVMGWVDMVSVVIRASLVQLDTPDEMRGRVSAVNAVFIGTSNELGEFESGITAAWFGVVPAVLIGGCRHPGGGPDLDAAFPGAACPAAPAERVKSAGDRVGNIPSERLSPQNESAFVLISKKRKQLNGAGEHYPCPYST